jgi:hypothetical protein
MRAPLGQKDPEVDGASEAEDEGGSALTNSEVSVAAAVTPAARKERRFMVYLL